MMTIPATCPDFVSHPHKPEGESCYTCACAYASENQGTSQIAEELQKLGIPCDVHQTGGFTMCVYVNTGDNSYIYASAEGMEIRHFTDEGNESEVWFEFDENATATQKAQKIADVMKENNLTAKEIK